MGAKQTFTGTRRATRLRRYRPFAEPLSNRGSRPSRHIRGRASGSTGCPGSERSLADFFIASSARRALVDLVMGTLARRICVYVHFRLLRFEEAQSPRESRVRATPDKRFYADRLIEGLRRIIPG
jgi:hypothetical protein